MEVEMLVKAGDLMGWRLLCRDHVRGCGV